MIIVAVYDWIKKDIYIYICLYVYVDIYHNCYFLLKIFNLYLFKIVYFIKTKTFFFFYITQKVRIVTYR